MPGSGLSCQMARAKLAQAVGDLQPSSLADKAIGAYKSLLLAGPHVFAMKAVNDTGNFLGRVLVDQPLAAGLDQLAAVAKSARTMFETPASSFRTVPGTLFDSGAWRAMRDGLGPDTEKAMALLKTGVDVDRASDAWNLGRTTFGSPVLTRALNFTSNAIEGLTKIPQGLAFREALYRNAKLLAMHEGGTAADVTAATNRYLANPTSEMILNATALAEKAVFKNQTVIGQMAEKLKGAVAASDHPMAQVARVGLETQIPFTRVPSAAFMQGVERSPIGLVSSLAEAAFGRGSPEGEAIVTRVSKGLTGTAASIGLGLALYKAGKLTGAEPADARQRAMWQLQGKIPNAVKIGDRWQSITTLGPFAFPLLFMANLAQAQDAQRQGATGGQQAAAALHAGGTMLTEASYLHGITAITDAAKGGPPLARLGAGMVPIPGVVRAAESATDDKQREARTFVQMLQSRIPGLAEQLPARLNALGQPMANDRSLVGAVGLSRGSDVIHDPAVDAAARYGVPISYPSPTVTVRGKTSTLTPAEYRQLLETRGPILERAINDVAQSPGFAALPTDGDRHTAMLKVLEKADEMSRKLSARQRAIDARDGTQEAAP
jgi:hypothetical protein